MLRVSTYFLLLLAVLVGPSQEHQQRNATCSFTFHEHIQKAIEFSRDYMHGQNVFSDCCQMMATVHLTNGHMKTGVYEFHDPCASSGSGFALGIKARCDADSGNGGWTVIQRRVESGTLDFYRYWHDYEEGFGALKGEFWYGLKNIHCLTKSGSMEMRMDMEDESGNKITWTYQEFHVKGHDKNYRLHIGGGEGTPGTTDVMAGYNATDMYFSTKDRDNDQSSSHCAQHHRAGWWYNSCTQTNPNGLHDSSAGIHSRVSSSTTGSLVYYPVYKMKVRRKSCAMAMAQTSDTCA